MAVLNVVINGTHVELPDGGSVLRGDSGSPACTCRRCATTTASRQRGRAGRVSCRSRDHQSSSPPARRHWPMAWRSRPTRRSSKQTRRGILEMLVHRYPADAIRAVSRQAVSSGDPRAGLIDRAAESVFRITTSKIARTRTSPSTWRDASIATVACASARSCRGSSCGTCATAACETRIRARRPDAARELVRRLRRVRRYVPDRRARRSRPSRRSPCPRSGRERPARTAASGASWTSAPAAGASFPSRPCSTRRSARGTSASRGGTPSTSCPPPTASPSR